MTLIKYTTNLILIRSLTCVNNIWKSVGKFATTDTKLYVYVTTLSIQYKAKLLQQLKLVFKRTINWNKYQSKVTLQVQNQDLYYLDSIFPGANRIFVLSFEDDTH